MFFEKDFCMEKLLAREVNISLEFFFLSFDNFLKIHKTNIKL